MMQIELEIITFSSALKKYYEIALRKIYNTICFFCCVLAKRTKIGYHHVNIQKYMKREACFFLGSKNIWEITFEK